MPEMLTARVSPQEYLEAAAIAAELGVSVSQLTRDSLFGQLPDWRKKALQAATRRANLPHGTTDDETNKAADALVAAINRSEPIRLDLGELFSPRSRAIYRLLAWVWQEAPPGDAKKMLDKLTVRVAERAEQVGPLLDADPKPAAPTGSKSKVKDYPRRGTKR